MLALFGEKNVRLFPVKHGISEIVAPISVDYEDFFKNYSSNASSIILNSSYVDFSLNYMQKVLIFESLESLRCKRKILKENERAEIVKKKKFAIFSRGDFCIQNTVINDLKMFDKITRNTGVRDVFVIEQAICELCKSVVEINDDTWWLYVAEHKSGGIKITAGLGNGIAYSRLFFDVNETERKIKETLRFLAREGLDESVKIISFMNGIFIDDIEILTPTMPQPDIETALVDIIKNQKKNMVPVFSKDNDLRRFLSDKNTVISVFLSVCMAICCLFLWHCYDASAALKNAIQIEKNKLNIFVKDASRTLFTRIKEDNFDSIDQFIEVVSKMRDPLVLLEKVSKILNGRNIDELQIDSEGTFARFKIAVDASELSELMRISKDQKNGIRLKILTKENEDIFENFKGNEKYGVEVCVKMS